MFEESYFHSAFLRVFKPTGEVLYCTEEGVDFDTLEDAHAEGPRLRDIYPDGLIVLDYTMMKRPNDEGCLKSFQEVWVDAKQRFEWVGTY